MHVKSSVARKCRSSELHVPKQNKDNNQDRRVWPRADAGSLAPARLPTSSLGRRSFYFLQGNHLMDLGCSDKAIGGEWANTVKLA